MRIFRAIVNPPRGTGNRAARLRLAFFFRANPALLRIIINKVRSPSARLGAMRGGSECEARAVSHIETLATAHLLRFKCYRM